ncbi:MAG: molybdopterin cofactor-binding domain-containing protein [Geminicoccaceae bacterium]
MLHYLSDEMLGTVGRKAAEIVLSKADRRTFLRGSAATAAFAIVAHAGPADAFVRYPVGGEQMPHGLRYDPMLFVTIDEDGTVTIVAHRSEMGTGSRTSLPMVVADEMEADWSRVKLVQAEGDEPKYGNQDTDGSRSMRHHIQSMRQIGASVRHMLAQAAAKEWGIDASAVTVSNHTVTGGGNSVDFGALAKAAMSQPVPAFEALSFKSEDEFRYIGKGDVSIYDLHDITTGKALYGADIKLPGMKYAVIARPPVVGGKVKAYDATETLKVPGVVGVIEVPGSVPPAKFAPLGGIAVIATNTFSAIEGRDKLKIEWDGGPHAGFNTPQYKAAMMKAAEGEGKVLRNEGNVIDAFQAARQTFAASYYQPHMAHIPMEPPAAVAEFKDGKLDVWAPVQSPYGTRQDLAADMGLDEANVRVNVSLLGGGFGRKSKCDFVIEAARLSKAVGAPVLVQWTREDDVRHSFYHTTSVERISVAIDENNKVTGWLHRSVAPSILSTFAPDSGHQFFIENAMGHVDMPFEIANVRCENPPILAHTRVGWFRSVSNVPRAFAVQSFVSELAHELGRDEREMLLELLGRDRKIDPQASGFPADFWNYGEVYQEYPIDTARLKHVLNVAADAIGWGKEMPKGEGLGLAVHRSFVTYVAAAVRVKMDGSRITVPEVHLAIDCGYAANPERIRSQLEGAAVQGMTIALKSGITFENGAVVESNFHDYDVVRADNFPMEVHTHIVDHPFEVHASGVGEPGVPPMAPAIANAIFNATGKRLRELPFGEEIEV